MNPRLKRRKAKAVGVLKTVPRRYPAHLAFVRGFVCAIGDAQCAGGIEAAHCRTGTDGAQGIKPADWWALPLCSHHHQSQHAVGENAFERKHNLDMKAVATAVAKMSSNRNIRTCAGRKVEDIRLEELENG